MATGYVTNWGNDANDGLTWETSKRTFQGAKDVALSPVYAKGWFDSFADIVVIGVESLIINLRKIALTYSKGISNCLIYNGDKSIAAGAYSNYKFFTIRNSENCNFYRGSYGIAYNITGDVQHNYMDSKNNTVHNSNIIYFRAWNDNVSDTNIIVSKTKVAMLYKSTITYSLFSNSKLKFAGGTLGTDETDYSYPSGADDDAKLQNLRDRMVAVYGGQASNYLLGCKYYSRNAPDGQEETEPYASAYKDIFVDADNGDFNLVPFCIAAHMSYEGDYIGARPEGFKFDWSSDWTNLVNINTSGEVIDQSLDASAISAIMDLTHVRQVLSFNDLGDRASRNGQQINTESTLSALIAPGAAVMAAGKTYMVDGDVITVDNAVMTSYDPFVTFVAVDEGGGAGLGFSSTIGNIREVLIDRYDSKSQYKFSKTDPTLASAVAITCYNASSPIYVNVDIKGYPVLGDADAGYDEATAVLLYARYMQKILLIKADNLPAR